MCYEIFEKRSESPGIQIDIDARRVQLYDPHRSAAIKTVLIANYFQMFSDFWWVKQQELNWHSQ